MQKKYIWWLSFRPWKGCSRYTIIIILCSKIFPFCCFSSWIEFLSFFLGSCYPTTLLLGDDMRLCSVWKLCCLWRPGQHLLYLQPENPWGKCACQPWAGWAHRWGGGIVFILPSSIENREVLLTTADIIKSPVTLFSAHVSSICSEIWLIQPTNRLKSDLSA